MTRTAGSVWRRGSLHGAALAGALALVVVAGSATPVGAQSVDVIGSFQSASGEYVFDTPTVSHSLMTGVSVLVGGRWRFGGSIAVIAQDNSVLTFVGGQPVPTGGRYSGVMRTREPGERVPMRQRSSLVGATLVDSSAAPVTRGSYAVTVGDPVLSAAVDVYRSKGGTSRLSAQVLAKVPFATVESGVGTEAFDYGASAAFSAGMGRVFGYVDASYWTLGDMPELELRDIVNGAVGLGLSFGREGRWSMMASVAGGTAAIANVEGPLAAGASLGRVLSPRRAVNAGIALGLSEGSPDWSAHVGIRIGDR